MNYLWLNILDRIVLVNVNTVQICSFSLNCSGKLFLMPLPFIVLLMFIMSLSLFTKCDFILTFFGLVLVVFDAGGF